MEKGREGFIGIKEERKRNIKKDEREGENRERGT